MSVIVSRALPDVRDGLKPVHRRVLYGMLDLGVMHNRPYKKSARIVGEVLGKYHPHGDTSVYDTMVRMAQEWSLRYMLVDGQGNYGSVDGDPPAAMRYTEARFRKITEELLSDIEKDTVDFRPNFDDSLTEPTVLPSRIPNLLMNGASGIAVGMATNMAPHNLTEIINGILAYIDDNNIDIDGLMKHIKAPDFPTGGTIYGYEGVKEAFHTGRGRVVMRAKANIEPVNNRERIVVTEIPYQINKAEMIKRQWELCNEKKIEGITEIRDESNREGMRIVYELRSDAISNVVLNNLYKYSALQTSFSINNVVLVKGRPEMLNLKDMIFHFVEHRHDVVVRRTKFDLIQAEKRAHILEGLLIAQKNIEEVIKIIRESDSPDAAKDELISRFSLSEIQARAILDMRLRTLTGLEVDKLNAEYEELMKSILHYKDILSNEVLRYQIIREELVEIKEKYGDERRTDIVYAGSDLKIEDMIADEDVVITISHLGYMKRTNLADYRSQNRGGRGSKGTATRDEDFVEHMFIASTHNYILLFTEKGSCFWIRAYEVPEGNKQSKGRALQNLISISADDKVKAFINIKNLNDEEYIKNNFIILCTKDGIIKKTSVEAYSRPRANGINAITIREGDVLLEAALTNGNNEIMIATKMGKVCRFPEAKVRPMGRNASGVKGIDLNDEEGGTNEVVGMICISDMQANVLVVSEKGYGKRSDIDEYRVTNRGGKGVKTINITEKTGNLVGIKSVTDANDLMIITKNGIAIRMAVSNLRVMGRATQGVKLINIQDSDSIAAVTKVDHEEEVEAVVEGEVTPEIPTGDITAAETPSENEESKGEAAPDNVE
jgi:DNA gyrase subunit A